MTMTMTMTMMMIMMMMMMMMMIMMMLMMVMMMMLMMMLMMVMMLMMMMLLMMMACFILSWSFLGSNLSSQTDPPTFKNDGFMTAGARFLKNRDFRSKDGFENVLELKLSSNQGD